MISILQVFYSVFSGLILSLAIPNEFYLLGMPFLSLFALIPLYFAFRICRNYKDAFDEELFLSKCTDYFYDYDYIDSLNYMSRLVDGNFLINKPSFYASEVYDFFVKTFSVILR